MLTERTLSEIQRAITLINENLNDGAVTILEAILLTEKASKKNQNAPVHQITIDANSIVIRYDFSLGDELPYGIAKTKTGGFSTNCLEFFSTDYPNAVIVRKDGAFIKVIDLLNNVGGHTQKHIRHAHNLHKMLIADSFTWRLTDE